MFHAAPPMASLFRANAAAMTSGLRSATFRIWWREKKGEADDHLRFGGVAVRAQAARLSGREGDRIRVEGGRHRRPRPGVPRRLAARQDARDGRWRLPARSEEHTSELQSLMRISYAVFCLKKNNK